MACANRNEPNTNGAQFFISLDRCEWLDKKNTIFGKVTGDTLYNLTRLGEVEVCGCSPAEQALYQTLFQRRSRQQCQYQKEVTT